MITPADEFIKVIIPFHKLFSKPVSRHVQLLLVGAVLVAGTRTVSAVLPIPGLKEEKNSHKYLPVLSLVEWSALEAAGMLLKLLLAYFLPVGPVILVINETLERHWVQKIAQRDIGVV